MTKVHLTLSERIVIEGMLKNGRIFAEIGRAVNKNRSTISREVQNHCIEKKINTFNQKFNDCQKRTNCPMNVITTDVIGEIAQILNVFDGNSCPGYK
ncbi:MAG: helix-turn-helix domain-containing protein [Sphaerochaeta sp.]